MFTQSQELPLFTFSAPDYKPRRPEYFDVQQIVVTSGRGTSDTRRMIEQISSLYPDAPIIERPDCAHNQSEAFTLERYDMQTLHNIGKNTLLFGTHQSSIRHSEEQENTCPNYWHFSLYGFCPYGCSYCYLAGTTSVRFAPAVKIFTNINQILDSIHRKAVAFSTPESFYHGKLQDGLALDPLTGYSLQTVPFFAKEKQARQVILTKSADVDNLLGLEHNGHTALSWTLNLPEVQQSLEVNTPSIDSRIIAIRRCSEAGYPVRVVLMPLVPVENWLDKYVLFLSNLLQSISIQRLTIGSICSFPTAIALMNRKLGTDNIISNNLSSRSKTETDGRNRYPFEMRKKAYELLITQARKIQPELEIGICLESRQMLNELTSFNPGKCNCLW